MADQKHVFRAGGDKNTGETQANSGGRQVFRAGQASAPPPPATAGARPAAPAASSAPRSAAQPPQRQAAPAAASAPVPQATPAPPRASVPPASEAAKAPRRINRGSALPPKNAPAPAETAPRAASASPPQRRTASAVPSAPMGQANARPRTATPGRSAARPVRGRGGVAVKQRPARWPLYALAALFLVLVLALVGWFIWGGKGDPATPAADPSGEWPAQVGDRLVDAQPETLVSLSPMVTEALLDLPGSGRLRAITEYCDGRESGLPTVGTPLLPRIEEIISLAPTYVLCQTPLTDTVKNQLEQAGIRVITLTTPTDLAGLRQFYGELGALLGGNVTGRALGYGVIDRMASTLGLYSAATGKTATALLLPDLSGLAATADTVEWALLGNLFSHPLPEATGWLAEAGELNDDDPANDLAQVLAADPDLLLVPDTVSPDEVSAALGSLRAVQNGAVIYYNSRLVETLSPRLVFTLADAAALAYPTLTPPAAKSTT